MVLLRWPIRNSKRSSRKWWSFTKIEMRCFHTHLTCTTHHSQNFTVATPYSLVFRMETTMHLEVEISSLKVLMDAELKELKWAKLKFE
jgi:hypothetical protein